jgi:hypothetical protein
MKKRGVAKKVAALYPMAPYPIFPLKLKIIKI